jgi:hypothetical protein
MRPDHRENDPVAAGVLRSAVVEEEEVKVAVAAAVGAVGAGNLLSDRGRQVVAVQHV